MEVIYNSIYDITEYFYKLLQYPIEIIIGGTTNMDSSYMQLLLNTNIGIKDTVCNLLKDDEVACIFYTVLPLYYHMCKQLVDTFTKENLQEITNTTIANVEIDCGMIKYLN